MKRTPALLAALLSLYLVAAGARAAPVPASEPEGKADAPKEAEAREELPKLSGLLQAWYFVRDDESRLHSFRLRRAEIKLSGAIVRDTFEYSVMVDPAKTLRFRQQAVPVQDQTPAPVPGTPGETVLVPQPPTDTSILQDYSITWLSPYANISLGQFKTPISYEGYNSSGRLLLPERALAARAYGDARDVGVRAEQEFGPFGYVFTVTNGAGINRVDTDNDKDLALRLELSPIPVVKVAIAGLSTLGSRESAATKDRAEVDLLIDAKPFIALLEYHRGWDGAPGARVEGYGGYAALGYTLFEVLQPVLRVGVLDPDVNLPQTMTHHYEAGLNWLLRGHDLKAQAAAALFDPSTGTSTRDLTVSAQARF